MQDQGGTKSFQHVMGTIEPRAFGPTLRAAHRDEMMRYADFVVSTAHSLQQMQPEPPLITSLSVGACLIDPSRGWNDWYAQADTALYRAKSAGGNRVEWQD